jgi:putative acetyltransferase
MAVTVRFARADEGRTYLEIVNRAIRALATASYPPEVIDAWAVAITDESVRALMINADKEIRLIAELDGTPVGIGALVVAHSELRACYVAPEGARRGCGSALVAEIERIARENGLTRLELVASINAEPFYASHGYCATERCEHVLPNGTRMAAVAMSKRLGDS